MLCSWAGSRIGAPTTSPRGGRLFGEPHPADDELAVVADGGYLQRMDAAAPTRSRRRLLPSRRRTIVYAALLIGVVGGALYCTSMPGRSFSGTAAADVSALADELHGHVHTLASAIGPRHLRGRTSQLEAAREYLRANLEGYGYRVTAQAVTVGDERGENLEAVLLGSGPESFVVGAHYDSVALEGAAGDCPGADDNASGAAVTLALAKRMRERAPEPVRSVRFVFFVNEEPPYFWQETMGSLVYARSVQNAHVIGMWSLETVGYYRHEDGTQHYPPGINLLYPSRGDFIGFVGNVSSRALVRSTVAGFRQAGELPSQGAAVPEFVQGVGWSDHWSFWQVGVPALMITDTAPFRNPHYHTDHDGEETLDYPAMARLTQGLLPVLERIARADP